VSATNIILDTLSNLEAAYGKFQEVGVDNAELVIQELLPNFEVTLMTVTKQEEGV